MSIRAIAPALLAATVLAVLVSAFAPILVTTQVDPTTGIIRGDIRDRDSGGPLQLITIHLYDGLSHELLQTVCSRPRGDYMMAVPFGTYVVDARGDGQCAATGWTTLTPAVEVTVSPDQPQTESIIFLLARAGEVADFAPEVAENRFPGESQPDFVTLTVVSLIIVGLLAAVAEFWRRRRQLRE